MYIRPKTAILIAVVLVLGFLAGYRAGQGACYDLLASLDGQLDKLMPLEEVPPPRARPGDLQL